MNTSNSVDIVHAFWDQVWNAHLEVIESFQNADGSRVASRWLLTGKNSGFAGTAPDQQDIKMTGTAVWAVRADGKRTNTRHSMSLSVGELAQRTRATPMAGMSVC